MPNPYLEKFRDAQKNRESIYVEIYNGSDPTGEATVRAPSKRGQRRIDLYKSIMGRENGRILEIGCGSGDLTVGLAANAAKVIGTDVSAKMIKLAENKLQSFRVDGLGYSNVSFARMGATDLKYPEASFDWVVSTSLIEHLHPDDIQPHLLEVLRLLKPGGRYLVWAPNRLGHHDDRDFHLSMFSYAELVGEMRRAGFKKFYTTFFNFSSLVNAGLKISLENWLTVLRIKTFWSHLGVRNILLVAEK